MSLDPHLKEILLQMAAAPQPTGLEEMRTAVDQAAAQIAAGEIAVHDYTTDETCPALQF